MKHYLIDGSGYIFRAYHALPPMTRADGTPVNAVYGFCNILLRLEKEVGAENVIVVFDAARRTFRNDIYPAYKEHRPDAPEDLIPQFSLIREAVDAFGIPRVEMDGYEADDLLATYAAEAVAKGEEVVIVSGDKDLMQLMRQGVGLLDPIKNKPLTLEDVHKKFGVTPDKVVDVQALAGDSVDNIPGVPGIGIKTAAELINTFDTLENLLDNAHTIKQPKRRQTLLDNREKALLSKQLVTLKADVPVSKKLAEFGAIQPDMQRLSAFLQQQNFKALLNRLSNGASITTQAPHATATTATPEKATYTLITDEKSLNEWVKAIQQQGFVAIDTETTSLNAHKAELVGISLALHAGKACYIPVGHLSAAAESTADLFQQESVKPQLLQEQLPLSTVLNAIKPILADQSIVKIGQNIKYDMLVLAKYAVTMQPIEDTMIQSYILHGARHGHGMDELAERYLDYKTISYKDITGSGKKKISFAEVSLAEACQYAAEDADITLRLYQLFKPQLPQDGVSAVYETLERPLIPILTAMEQQGIKVDVRKLQSLSSEFGQAMMRLETEIHKLVGHPFNIGSPKQLGVVLFEELKLSGGKLGKTGAYGTASDILEPLAAAGHIVPKLVLQWRQLAKLKSTYADALLEQRNPETDRVHTSFSQAVTSTGRLSSSDPNLQNIPIRTEEGRKIRTVFIAEQGCKLIALDYSQIELRLLAEIADITTLKQAFAEGIDIHTLTASQVFGVPLAEVDNSLRRRAKTINFGIIYGISAFGLANQLGCPQSEAAQLITAYFKQYPGIKAYMEETIAFCRKNGYVQTLFGRRCPIQNIHDKNANLRNFAERAAINAPIQGTAADIIKRAMIRISTALQQANLQATLLLQVHDELVFEAQEKDVAAVVSLVTTMMEQAALPVVKLSVPLLVEAGVGDTWGEAH